MNGTDGEVANVLVVTHTSLRSESPWCRNAPPNAENLPTRATGSTEFLRKRTIAQDAIGGFRHCGYL